MQQRTGSQSRRVLFCVCAEFVDVGVQLLVASVKESLTAMYVEGRGIVSRPIFSSSTAGGVLAMLLPCHTSRVLGKVK